MTTTIQPPTDIRPFQRDIPGQKLDELRDRIAATRWPSKELVADRSQGVQLATLQALARSRREPAIERDRPQASAHRADHFASRDWLVHGQKITSLVQSKAWA